MNKVFGVLCSLLVLFLCSEVSGKCADVTGNFEADYQQYLKCFYPNYQPGEDHPLRLQSFLKCYQEIMAQQESKTETHEVALSRFCHWTEEEFNRSLNHAIPQEVTPHVPARNTYKRNRRNSGPLPSSWDWRTQNVVSPIKDQGSCGNCYTFSGVGAVEGQVAQLSPGSLFNLSTQQYTDCSVGYGASTGTSTSCSTSKNVTTCTTTPEINWLTTNGQNNGCNGGMYTACWAYNNITSTYLTTDSCYPDTSATTGNSSTCQYNPQCLPSVKFIVSDYILVPPLNETALQEILYEYGPVSCVIYSTPISTYSSGIFSNTSYSNSPTNHAILVVGYGNQDGVNYWIVKNSWGTGWGELGGYFEVMMGENIINISSACAVPIVELVK